MKASETNGFWRPPPTVRAAINRGERRFTEWQKQIAAEAEAERLAKRRHRRQRQ